MNYVKLDNGIIVQTNGELLTHSTPYELPPMLSPTVEVLSAIVVRDRNSLLQQSDWTQLPDVPLATKEAWAVYRQALRDITQQPGYPTEVNWPVAPT